MSLWTWVKVKGHRVWSIFLPQQSVSPRPLWQLPDHRGGQAIAWQENKSWQSEWGGLQLFWGRKIAQQCIVPQHVAASCTNMYLAATVDVGEPWNPDSCFGLHWGSCSSGGRVGCLVIRRSLVWILALPSCMSKCPWARYWPQIAPDEQLAPWIAASAISAWMCVWMSECGKYCKALWAINRLEKCYKNARLFTIVSWEAYLGLFLIFCDWFLKCDAQNQSLNLTCRLKQTRDMCLHESPHKKQSSLNSSLLRIADRPLHLCDLLLFLF